ncbi:hypothetical protein [Iningainema tapete]|uniref:Uncharacterized protein n=1 Tax=Iningainema tapete BLCC-T55 TaxID=2748662 RepID=A0A8J6XT46_9CYAN|nr:hypothetical protein [Iningainema tapete]MBD2777934.1 hypothetical protein [Iningainema tapete BLCC-T55]
MLMSKVDDINKSFFVELQDDEAEAINGGVTISADKFSLSVRNFFLNLGPEVSVFVEEANIYAEDLLVSFED